MSCFLTDIHEVMDIRIARFGKVETTVAQVLPRATVACISVCNKFNLTDSSAKASARRRKMAGSLTTDRPATCKTITHHLTK